MILQITLGIGMIVLSVVLEILVLELAINYFKSHYGEDVSDTISLKQYILRLINIVLWLIACMMVIIFSWTFLFEILGVFDSFYQSLYFSLVAFTTLGFGDIVLPENWNLLSGFIAADGFFIFGLNTALMMNAMQRIRPM